jgi:TolB protein
MPGVLIVFFCLSACVHSAKPDNYVPLTIAHQLTRIPNSQRLPTNDEPFPSPNGRQLVIESNRTGKQQLYAISDKGQLLRRITHDSGSDDTPSWSHDGRHIAYVSIRSGHSGLYVIDATGRAEHRLAGGGLDYLHPMWSNDNRWIIYNVNTRRDPTVYELWVMRADGTSIYPITHNHYSETTYGSWSPDGHRIAYRRKFLPYRSQVYVAQADGTQAHNLSNTDSYDGWPSWSPDGRLIVFSSNRLEGDKNSRNSEIFLMDSNGTNVRLIARVGGRNVEPRFSPNGKVIYFSHCLHLKCEAFAVDI